ncbi:DNA polymerase III subunit epsilon [Enterococcus sp. DIV0840]|uniref:exonuclease domain-containing protein n=1 Tax=unclassified Enterococcus TaxID=2608891 RepID=UPI001A8DF065|nr:3'-5' exoribonuclease [Enterococcus sp. DIV0849a]
MKDTFIALDVETANDNRHSICSIGLVKFENGLITNEFYSLINPEEKFDSFNTNIHGIDYDLVKESPSYEILRPNLIEFIGDSPIVCHFAQFDTGAIRDANAKYDLENFEFNYLCTYQLSRALLTRLSYKLKNLAKEFNISFQHHDALEDARACGLLLLELAKLNSSMTTEELLEHANYKYLGKVTHSDFSGFRKKANSSSKNLTLSLTEADSSTFNQDHEFYQKNIVFTGTLISMNRRDAMQLVKNIGGTPQNGVNQQTNFLVMGEQDLSKVDSSGKSSKIKKAEGMLAKGLDVQLLGENDFLKLMNE